MDTQPHIIIRTGMTDPGALLARPWYDKGSIRAEHQDDDHRSDPPCAISGLGRGMGLGKV